MPARRHTVAAALITAATLFASAPLGAQANAPIIGRWDLTVQGKDGAYPSWVEVSLSGGRTLVGRFVHGGGSARPIAKVTFTDGIVRFAIPPQWDRGNADLIVEARLANDQLTGTLTTPDGEKQPLTGVRAPALRRSAAPVWETPITLFGGTDMAAWEPMGDNSQWRVVNGILTNTASGTNLRTKRTFDDFKLHVEFRVPKGGNSGVYLRGRHEVQVEDTPIGEPKSVDVGGIYGFLVPNEPAQKPAGEWQTFDITLIGRRVTVVLNGKAIIVDQTIPGITGGAIDSKEGEPGPIYLQGDHTAVEYRNIVITPARAAK